MSISSFDEFAERELDGLLRYATALTGDRDTAADLVQEVLLKVLRRWTLVDRADNQRAYVRTMVTRTYVSWRRSWAVRHIAVPAGDLPEPAPAADHAHHIAERSALWPRVMALPRRQRSVLVLRYYENLTDAEIAQVLGCAAVTVRGYASRALATLRLDSDNLADPLPAEDYR